MRSCVAHCGDMNTVVELLFEDEAYRIRNAAFAVHNEIGNGFLEGIYQECLEYELEKAGIPFKSKSALGLVYKGVPLRHTYESDLICFDKIILELKAASTILPVHRAQTKNYLKLTGLTLGLIINFGTFPKCQIERVVLSPEP